MPRTQSWSGWVAGGVLAGGRAGSGSAVAGGAVVVDDDCGAVDVVGAEGEVVAVEAAGLVLAACCGAAVRGTTGTERVRPGVAVAAGCGAAGVRSASGVFGAAAAGEVLGGAVGAVSASSTGMSGAVAAAEVWPPEPLPAVSPTR
jgi:hypothetical protein